MEPLNGTRDFSTDELIDAFSFERCSKKRCRVPDYKKARWFINIFLYAAEELTDNKFMLAVRKRKTFRSIARLCSAKVVDGERSGEFCKRIVDQIVPIFL